MKRSSSSSAWATGLVAAAAAVAALAVAHQPAQASMVSVDFESVPAGYGTSSNLVSDGVVFSPDCHYDIPTFYSPGNTPAPSGHWIGFDASGCSDPAKTNPDYLGGQRYSGANLYVALDGGGAFTLDSFDFMQIGMAGMTMRSSNGGVASVGTVSNTHYDFSAPEWTGIDWLLFSTFAGAPVGLDNLRLDVQGVPEPGSVLLALSALLTAAAAGARPGRRSPAR